MNDDYKIGVGMLQASAMKDFFQIAECSKSYAKMSQTSAMKGYFQIAECSKSYAKLLQTSAMKDFFQIAECSKSYAKVVQKSDLPKRTPCVFSLQMAEKPVTAKAHTNLPCVEASVAMSAWFAAYLVVSCVKKRSNINFLQKHTFKRLLFLTFS